VDRPEGEQLLQPHRGADQRCPGQPDEERLAGQGNPGAGCHREGQQTGGEDERGRLRLGHPVAAHDDAQTHRHGERQQQGRDPQPHSGLTRSLTTTTTTTSRTIPPRAAIGSSDVPWLLFTLTNASAYCPGPGKEET